MKGKHFRRILMSTAAVLVISGLLTGCGLFPKEEDTLAPPLVKPKKQTYETAKVTRGSIQDMLQGTGSFISAAQHPVYFTTQGNRLKDIYVKVGDSVKKGQLLADTETGDLDTQIKLEKYQVQLQQLNVDQANAGGDAMAKQRAQIGLEVEQTKLDALNAQKEQSRLLSPVNGQVTSVASVNIGDTVDPYKAVVTVGDTTNLMVSFESTNAASAKLSMKATVGYKGATYTGTVISLPNGSTTSSQSANSVSTNDNSDAIKISLDKTPSGATIGDSADVTITLQKKDNTLVIPARALNKFMSEYSVYVWDGSTKKEYTVTPGIQTSTQAEILSGVTEGQTVILN